MSNFIWELVPFYDSKEKNKFLCKISNEGKIDLENESNWPNYDIYEDKSFFYIEVELPGLDKEFIEIYMTDEKIIVVGNRPFPELKHNRTYYIMKRNYGDFKKIFDLPENINAKSIKVNFNSGLLKIKVKKEK